MPDKVVFACVRNAGRSQMAAGWFRFLADPSKAFAVSAGTEPASQVHPGVVDAMREVGIDLTAEKPRLLTHVGVKDAALLVTMGCEEACPVVPGVERDDWPLEDPKDLPIERVRLIRNDVRARVEALIHAHGWNRAPCGATCGS